MLRDRIIVIVGPTAGGKSELAVGLAEKLGGEVLGADSMQVYRGMDAGTAKPERALRERAAHHLIDIVEPTERFTVADWLEQAEAVIAGLHRRGRVPIVVGGTNLYIKALLEGMFDGPAIDEAFRASLASIAPQELHRRLQAVDPPSAARIHANDHKKLVRALEVFHVTGQPISAMQTQWDQARTSVRPEATSEAQYRHSALLVGLEWEVKAINRRINARVKEMFFPRARGTGQGHETANVVESLPEETARLEAAGLLGPQAREALGYKQVLAALHGEMTMDEAFEKTKVLTRRFAKTQRTWLKRYRGVRWINAADMRADQILDQALSAVRDGRHDPSKQGP